jgi:putative NADPH-quinone reductase
MKILIIFAHPSKKTFNRDLLNSYKKGLRESSHKIDQIDLTDLNLETFLKNDYRSEIKLKGNLLKAQKQIKQADHLVFFFPIWWATPPALLKVFLEVVLQSGFAYKYTKPLFGFIPRWNKLLKGKTARIIVTMGAPIPYHKYILGEPAFKMMKANLEFCGIKPVKKNYFGTVDTTSEGKKKKWLEKIYQVGLNE